MDAFEVVSALAAVLSAVWAWSSARSAAQSHQLALEQGAKQKPNIDMYLIDSEQLGADAGTDTTYRFRLRMTNLSEAPNAIVQLFLEIEYARGNSRGLQLTLPHQPVDDGASFRLPKLMQPKDSVDGWVTFTLPNELRQGARAETYQVTLMDAEANRFSVRPIIIPQRQV